MRNPLLFSWTHVFLSLALVAGNPLVACRESGQARSAATRGLPAPRGVPATSGRTPGADIPTQALSGKAGFTPVFGTDGPNAFRFPVWFGEIPGRAGHYLVLERGGGSEDGRIWLLEPQGRSYRRKVFLTVPVESSSSQGDERGLLGMAFHPGFPENGRYFLNYIPRRKPGQRRDSTVIEERRADSSRLADGGETPRRILAFEQPYANHNGGTLAFHPRDGFLYIGTGDGGGGGDPLGHGQNLASLLGKMLRIDVDAAGRGSRAYAIPGDNPFLGRKGARPEIWAYGLRNPWKWSFDSETGDLWAGDVGQNRFEEVDIVARGQNLGWNIMEAFACFEPRRNCPKENLVLPVAELERSDAQSITGGYVYRGDSRSPFFGAYVFGDYETRKVWALSKGEGGRETLVLLGVSPDQPSAFGVDQAGNLYLVGFTKGILYRLELPEP